MMRPLLAILLCAPSLAAPASAQTGQTVGGRVSAGVLATGLADPPDPALAFVRVLPGALVLLPGGGRIEGPVGIEARGACRLEIKGIVTQ